eukprot:GHVQ01017205.1.p1 GENE.GHVQ01017205.1~~GHVQ01017205.1.p1  ORF type:complete len:101 (+),score=17.25 GHVQ01017205.1:221-523(+)
MDITLSSVSGCNASRNDEGCGPGPIKVREERMGGGKEGIDEGRVSRGGIRAWRHSPCVRMSSQRRLIPLKTRTQVEEHIHTYTHTHSTFMHCPLLTNTLN